MRDVRIGLHSDKTRVVLDLDGAAKYRIERRSERELWLHLEADALPRVVRGRGRLLTGIRVEPGIDARGGTNVRLLLARAVEVRELVLKNPPRLVIDLLAPKRAVAVAKPPVASARAPVEKKSARAASPAPAKNSERPDWVKKVAPAPTQQAASDAAAKPDADAAAPAAQDASKRVVPVAAARARKPADWAGWLQDALDYLRELPTAWSAAGAAAVALGLLTVFVRRFGAKKSRRGGRDFLAPMSQTASAKRAPGSAATPSRPQTPAAAASPARPAAPAPATPRVREDVVTPGATAAPSPSPAPDVAATPVTPSAPAPSTAPSATSTNFEALSARLAEMEQRLASMAESKDRLERTAVAQTEELRAQRAAIARTQRVLRSLPRNEDGEPSAATPPLTPQSTGDTAKE